MSLFQIIAVGQIPVTPYDKQAWPAEISRDIMRTYRVAVVDDLVCCRNIRTQGWSGRMLVLEDNVDAADSLAASLAFLWHEVRPSITVASMRSTKRAAACPAPN